MNLANKLTMTRIVLTFIILGILLLPLDSLSISTQKLFINETLVVDIKYFISGGLFVIAFITDLLDGYVARKKHQETFFGKMLDAIADKILVDSLLIILASQGFIHPIFPIVIIIKDIVTDIIKLEFNVRGIEYNKSHKFGNFCLMLAITLTLFYNLPFELWNLRVSDFLLVFTCILAVITIFEYYNEIKNVESQ